MMASSRRKWLLLGRKMLIITAGAVVVLAIIGFVLGGQAGAARGAMLGVVVGIMGIPGLLLGLALNAGDSYAGRSNDAFDKRYGSGPGH